MQLLILRHGIAEDIGPDGTDESRRLTEEGIEKTGEVMKALAKFIPSPDVILTSPRTRAMQTADIAGKQLGLEPVVEPSLAALSQDPIIAMLKQREEQTILIVGHEPVFSALIEKLCTGKDPRHFVQMKKAGCALVEYEPDIAGSGELRWLTTPKMLLS